MFIENIINKAFALDPKALTYLKKLEGHSLSIQITPAFKPFFISFSKKGIHLTGSPPLNIDMSIQGSLKGLIKFSLSRNPHLAARYGLSINGDLEMLQAVQQLFFTLDADWEEALSSWTGDIPAHQIGIFFRAVKRKKTALLKNTGESLSLYLQEEISVLPAPAEVNYFLDTVDALRTDVERLEARINRLILSESSPPCSEDIF